MTERPFQGADSATRGGVGGDEPRAPALPVRWAQVLVAPARLFDVLGGDPRWFVTLLTGGAVVLLTLLALPAESWEELIRARTLESGSQVPADVAGSAGIVRAFSVAGATVFWFVWALVLGSVVTFIFGFVLGDRVRWRQAMSAVAHALLIVATGAIVTLPLKLARGDPGVSLTLATFVPGADGWLLRFLGGLDLFGLWSYVVMGIAVSRFDPGRGAGSAAGILVGLAVALGALVALIPA